MAWMILIHLLPLRDADSDFTTTGLNFLSLELSQGIPDWLGALGDQNSVANLPLGQQPSRLGGSGAFPEGEFTKLFFSATRFSEPDG